MDKLSENEILALIKASAGISLRHVPDRTETDVLGSVDPGLGVYKKLARKGLVVITEEDLIDEDDPDLGTWTPSVEITDEGKKVLTSTPR